MIYVLDPEIFDHFPDAEEVDFALDVFPALLDADIPFGVHVTDAYWNDVGSLPEYLQGNLDVLTGDGRRGAARAAGRLGRGGRSRWSGADRAGAARRRRRGRHGARLDGPVVVGPGASIGAGAMVRESVLLAGAEVPADGLLAGAIAGNASALSGSPAAARRE